MGALKDLLNSEKAIAGGVLVIAATVLTALGHMSIEQWKDYTTWIFGIYATGKTITSGVAMMTKTKPEAPVASKEPT